jgi:uncharacterized protein (DUF433 family)
MEQVRETIREAERLHGIRRLLLSPDLRAMPGRILLDRLGQLIELSASGQQAFRDVFEAYLDRLDRDESGTPFRLFPFSRRHELRSPRLVLIDPRISFGRPILESCSVKTLSIFERFESGESVESIASDYDIGTNEVEEAIRYERAA